MFFNGDHRKQREISLGGSGGTRNRDEILRRAQQARAEREAQRNREISTIVIQRQTRKFLAGQERYRQELARFHQQLAECDDDMVLQNMLLQFFRSPRDGPALLAYLQQATAKGRIALLWFAPEALAHLQWRARLQRFAAMAFSLNLKYESDACNQFLFRYLNASEWPAGNAPELAARTFPNVVAWCVDMVKRQVFKAKDMTAVVVSWISRSDVTGKSFAVALLQNLWCTEMADPVVREALFVEVLERSQVLEHFDSLYSIPSLSELSAGWLLYHFLNIPVERFATTSLAVGYLGVLDKAMDFVPLKSMIRDDDDDDNDTEMEDVKWPAAFAELPTLLGQPALLESQLMRTDSGEQASTAYLHLCRYFSRALPMCSKERRVSILSQLSYNKLFLGKLWGCLKVRLPEFLQEMQTLASKKQSMSFDSESMVFAKLFADCYNHILIIQSDEEFSSGELLTIEEVTEVVSMFKDAAVHLYINRLPI
jgi:hypothetical protein